MAELIEKVARLAGWKRGYLYNTPVFCNSTGDPLVYDDAIESLGLRILLDELLRNGRSILPTVETGRVIVARHLGPRSGMDSIAADTLEEAVMLAYCAMKEGV